MILISVVISVLYFTMFERKLMGYFQIRKGPNKVGIVGLFTPIADAIKLLMKKIGLPINSKKFVFWLRPVLAVIFLFVVWFLYPFVYYKNLFLYGFLFFVCIRRLSVYSVLGSGWGRKSKYSLLGALRGAAQVISYEILFIFISFFPLCFQGGFFLHSFLINGYWYVFWIFPVFVLWMLRCVAETKRSPFDFSEGERELVSGFKTEYRAMEFACLFLGEYGQIIFVSCLGVLMFVEVGNKIIYLGIGLFVSIGFIWLRCTFPRFRYDLLMELAWCWGLVFIIFFFFYLLSL